MAKAEKKGQTIKLSIFTPQGMLMGSQSIPVSVYSYDWNLRTVSYTVDSKSSPDHGIRAKVFLGEGWSFRIEEQAEVQN